MDQDATGSTLPQLTRFSMEVRTRDDGTRLLVASFLLNAQQLLLEDFDAAVNDAVLRHAHAAGHMPVGPMMVSTAPAQVSSERGTPEKPVLRAIEDLQIDNAVMMGDLVRVFAEVELGLSLL